MRGNLFFKWTNRPLLRILTTVKNKLVDKIAKKMGHQYRKDIQEALDGDFDQKIKEMMERKSLDLQDENQNLLFRQVTGGNEEKLKARDDDDDEDVFDEDEA